MKQEEKEKTKKYMGDNIIKKKAAKQIKAKPRVVRQPSAAQMKKFAKSFKKGEWEKLCQNREFLRSVDKDLIAAKEFADKILEEGEDENL